MKKYVIVEVPDWCDESIVYARPKGDEWFKKNQMPEVIKGKRAFLEKAFEVVGDVGADYRHDRPEGMVQVIVSDGCLTLGKLTVDVDSGVRVLSFDNLDDAPEPDEWEEEKKKRIGSIEHFIMDEIDKRCPRK